MVRSLKSWSEIDCVMQGLLLSIIDHIHGSEIIHINVQNVKPSGFHLQNC